MKNLHLFSVIEVLDSEPKMNRDNQNLQDMDKDGNKLFFVHVKETAKNEKFNIEEVNIVRYKSLVHLQNGNHVVALKEVAMGESNGSFTKVNKYYTILRTVDATKPLEAVFTESEKIIKEEKSKQVETPKKK